MSDAPPPIRLGAAAGGGPLTADRIDAILADFRRYLEGLADVPPPPDPDPPAVDLFTLVGQFTALRHEVNLQTKAARSAVEQTAAALKRLDESPAEADAKPLVKALVDIADALAVGLRQVEQAAAGLKVSASEPPPATDPGRLAKLFGATTDLALRAWADETHNGIAAVQPRLAGVADGYALSLRRVERALTAAGLEPINCVGAAFDPETMEVVEAVPGDDRPAGTVVAEVRRGYRWHGEVFRFAQVTVAR
jgi:molecular chaperone GrpE